MTRRKRLDTICVGVQDIESAVKEAKERFSNREVKITIEEMSILENCFYVTIWEVK